MSDRVPRVNTRRQASRERWQRPLASAHDRRQAWANLMLVDHGFLRLVYRNRHEVRPGITGLAQVTCGYAVGLMATAEKTRFDLHYIRARTLRLDALILWQTLAVVLRGGAGAAVSAGARAAARG